MVLVRLLLRLLLAILLCYLHINGHGEIEDPEANLIDTLLNETEYDRRVRPPIFDANGKKPPSNVTVSFGLYTVIGVDETHEKATVYVFVWEKWLDPRLAWDPDDFGGVEIITVEAANIWIPDVFIYNLEMGNSEDKGSRTHATIKPVRHADGISAQVTLAYGALLEERCRLRMTYYPFDQQTCSFCVGAMASTNSQIYFHADPYIKDKEHATQGGEWMLVRAEGVDGAYEDYTNACIEVTLHRRAIFYGINVFFPTVTVCLLNTVGLFSRLEESHTQMEIATLGQTTLLSLGVILLTVTAQDMPKGAIISLMGVFFVTMICQTLVATFTAMYLRNRYSCEERAKLSALRNSKHCVKNEGESNKTKTKQASSRGSSASTIRWERVCMLLHVFLIMVITVALFTVGFVKKPQAMRFI